jgi:S-disulfanyl-L-cysteine oxidoreductase SoxD
MKWSCIILYCSFAIACQGKRDIASNSFDAHADTTRWPASFGYGRTASAGLIAKLDIDIRPDGKGLPPGEANAMEGKEIYIAKCMACHGGINIPSGVKLPGPVLVNNPDSPAVKTIGNYWPYATTIFDYVRRTMPFNAPGSLTDKEVYAVTAYLLYANRLMDSTAQLNASTLSRIIMPAQKRFVADDRRGGPEIK